MARSGVAAAELVLELGGMPFVSDILPNSKLSEIIARLDKSNIPFECGKHSDRLLESEYIILDIPGTILNIYPI